ncbi:CRISPR-associated endonuclease Cas2 [Candidatus Bathyarchaeota archaeon]|nr:CRISPR-associated endonuclease Cas2 [Candidatus Bathyarchaeota archaeon]
MLTWVIYDISSDKIRGRVASICKKYGLYRVQKSAFLGTLNNNQLDSLALECEEAIEEEDSVFVFPMCESCYKGVRLIGKGFNDELVRDEVGTFIV